MSVCIHAERESSDDETVMRIERGIQWENSPTLTCENKYPLQQLLRQV